MNSGFEYSKDSDAERCLELLAISAIGAAHKAGMMDEVTRRVFERAPDDLVEKCATRDGGVQVRYRPMVELVLLELNAIGSAANADVVEQQRRIMWTLEMAGF
jgi:hypothetical protein